MSPSCFVAPPSNALTLLATASASTVYVVAPSSNAWILRRGQAEHAPVSRQAGPLHRNG